MKFIIRVACAVSLLWPRVATLAQSCIAANDTSTEMIRRINGIMSGSTQDEKGRIALGLPRVTPSEVVLVTDSTVCARGLQVLDSLVKASNPRAPAVMPPRNVYVIRVGTYTAVADRTKLSHGGYMSINFFDPNWSFLRVLLF